MATQCKHSKKKRSSFSAHVQLFLKNVLIAYCYFVGAAEFDRIQAISQNGCTVCSIG